MGQPRLTNICSELREWAAAEPSLTVEKLRVVVRSRKDAHVFVQKLAGEIELTPEQTGALGAGHKWITLGGNGGGIRLGPEARLVLHASPDARPLYERLGFEPTNEMRFTGELPGTAYG